MAERIETNPPGAILFRFIPHNGPPDPFEAQRRAVRGCLTEMFELDEPRDFQLRALARAVF